MTTLTATRPGDAPPARHEPAKNVAVQLQDVSLAIGDRLLLNEAQADFPAGQITLIVGPSGAGKSLLLRALARLDDEATGPQIRGQILIGGRSARRGQMGVVFQDFALFDDLSPAANVRFAQDHRVRTPGTRVRAHGPDRLNPQALLAELDVPPRPSTSQLSGGQRQRLAIARTLAATPDVILYDEPTSGLDPATAARVAERIRSTQSQHPTTSIVVTHDYQSLLSIADKVYLFDPSRRQLIEIPPAEWADLGRRLASLPPAPEPPPAKASAARAASARLLADTAGFLAATSRVVETAIRLPLDLLPTVRSLRWGLQRQAHCLQLVAGPTAWLYMALAGSIAGFVTTYFTFRFLPYSRYTEPLLIDDLLAAMGFALYRILVPVLATVLIAARTGAALTSDVGGKRFTRQWDALQTLRISPRAYLLTPILWAMLISTPLLAGCAYLAAAATSLGVFTATHPDQGPDFWHWHYHRALATHVGAWWNGTGWLLAKLLACGLGIGLIAFAQGAAPKQAASDISRSISRTIFWGTLYVLVVHFAFAFAEF